MMTIQWRRHRCHINTFQWVTSTNVAFVAAAVVFFLCFFFHVFWVLNFCRYFWRTTSSLFHFLCLVNDVLHGFYCNNFDISCFFLFLPPSMGVGCGNHAVYLWYENQRNHWILVSNCELLSHLMVDDYIYAQKQKKKKYFTNKLMNEVFAL